MEQIFIIMLLCVSAVFTDGSIKQSGSLEDLIHEIFTPQPDNGKNTDPIGVVGQPAKHGDGNLPPITVENVIKYMFFM